MKRYYNNTKKAIPYITTNFRDYATNALMHPGHYFSGKPFKGKHYAGFKYNPLVSFFKREDFDKLTLH